MGHGAGENFRDSDYPCSRVYRREGGRFVSGTVMRLNCARGTSTHPARVLGFSQVQRPRTSSCEATAQRDESIRLRLMFMFRSSRVAVNDVIANSSGKRFVDLFGFEEDVK